MIFGINTSQTKQRVNNQSESINTKRVNQYKSKQGIMFSINTCINDVKYVTLLFFYCMFISNDYDIISK